MTKNQLNSDVKKLAKNIAKARANFEADQDKYFKYIDQDARKEYLRLFDADSTFEYMGKLSILIMLRLNLRHRFIELHRFGSHINLEKLL